MYKFGSSWWILGDDLWLGISALIIRVLKFFSKMCAQVFINSDPDINRNLKCVVYYKQLTGALLTVCQLNFYYTQNTSLAHKDMNKSYISQESTSVWVSTSV